MKLVQFSLLLLLIFSAALPTLARAGCKEDFTAMAQVAAAAGPYSEDIQSEDGGQKMQLRLDYAAPKALRMTVAGHQSIVTLEGGWDKQGGNWVPMPAGTVRALQQDLAKPWFQRADEVDKLQCPGTQVLDGKSYKVMTFDIKSFLGAQALHHVTAFVNDKNLPMVLKAQKDGISKGSLTMRVTYDPALKIEAPVK